MCKNSGFRSRIQKSYKKFGIESKNLIIFSESIPNLLPPPCFLGLTQIAQISQAFFVGGKSHGGSAPLFPWAHTDRTDLTVFFVGGKSHRCSPLIFSKGSHRFNEIQREDYLWKFVEICGRKNLYKKIFV